MMAATLKITSVPPGEAPAWVREQWVGLSLPLAQPCMHAHAYRTSGVLSGPRSRIGQVFARLLGRCRIESGYAVEPLAAIEVLARSSPEAADWWRSNAAHMFEPGHRFIFQEGTGHVVGADPA